MISPVSNLTAFDVGVVAVIWMPWDKRLLAQIKHKNVYKTCTVQILIPCPYDIFVVVVVVLVLLR